MDLVHKAEKSLEPLFKDLPKLPKDAKKTIADIMPWLALIGGIAQVWAAWTLYRLYTYTNELAEWANDLSEAFGGTRVDTSPTIWAWLSIVGLAVSGVVMLIAFPKLQAKAKSGWDLVFLGSLINIVVGVLYLFVDGRGAGSLIWTLLSSAVGFYFLYQVREHFGGKKNHEAK